MFIYKFKEQDIVEYNKRVMEREQERQKNEKKYETLLQTLIDKCPIDKVILTNNQNSVEDDILVYYLRQYKTYIDNYLYNNKLRIIDFIYYFKKYLIANIDSKIVQ